MRSIGWLLTSGLLSMACVSWSPPAAAQEPTAAERTLARTEYRRGVAAVGEERWDDARDAFSRAYDLVRLPEILFNLAGAQTHTNELVEAAEGYRRFLRVGRGERERALRSDAERFLAELTERIPTVHITVEGLHRHDSVVLDGSPVSSAVVGGTLPINPGPHVIGVRRGGLTVARTEIDIAEGEAQDVELRVRAAPSTSSGATASTGDDGGLTSVAGVRDEDDTGGGALASPWFWIVAVAVVIAGGVVAFVLTRPDEESPYVGNVPGITL